jgi:hypothetical protein
LNATIASVQELIFPFHGIPVPEAAVPAGSRP